MYKISSVVPFQYHVVPSEWNWIAANMQHISGGLSHSAAVSIGPARVLVASHSKCDRLLRVGFYIDRHWQLPRVSGLRNPICFQCNNK